MPESNQQQPNAADQSQVPPEGESPQTWETWLESAPEDVRKLYEGHVTGLKSALDTERDQRKQLAKQLSDAAKQAADGSEAKTQLEKLSRELETAQKRADFFESIPGDVVSAKLAWIAAENADAFKRDGSPDWDMLRQSFPELFRKNAAPTGNAGAGTDQKPQTGSMNDFIRRAAGYP